MRIIRDQFTFFSHPIIFYCFKNFTQVQRKFRLETIHVQPKYYQTSARSVTAQLCREMTSKIQFCMYLSYFCSVFKLDYFLSTSFMLLVHMCFKLFPSFSLFLLLLLLLLFLLLTLCIPYILCIISNSLDTIGRYSSW